MLERGEMLPQEFTRPEVSKVLVEGMRRKIEAANHSAEEVK